MRIEKVNFGVSGSINHFIAAVLGSAIFRIMVNFRRISRIQHAIKQYKIDDKIWLPRLILQNMQLQVL